MLNQKDTIVEISKAREKYFGTKGRMLKPCPATIAELIKTLEPKSLLTVDLLRKKLAARFNVEVTCPSDTQSALRFLAKTAVNDLPCWRVIKKNGGLFSYFNGGQEGHAALLRKEGFCIETKGNTFRIINIEAHLSL